MFYEFLLYVHVNETNCLYTNFDLHMLVQDKICYDIYQMWSGISRNLYYSIICWLIYLSFEFVQVNQKKLYTYLTVISSSVYMINCELQNGISCDIKYSLFSKVTRCCIIYHFFYPHILYYFMIQMAIIQKDT